jgi:hypothetical protein
LRILTENNAFHNIAKSLQRECTDYDQIEDFLQYCIALIFYEKTYIVGTVPPNVVQDSQKVRGLLEGEYSIDNIDFEFVIDNTKEADVLINNVSEILCSRLDKFFNEYKTKAGNEALNCLPRLAPELEKLIKNTTRAINEKNIKILREEYLKISTFSNDSCCFKILNANEQIINKIFEFDNAHKWNEALTMDLLTGIRIISNRELAKMKDKIYLPSIKRGRIDKPNRLRLETRVESVIKKASDLSKLELPSIKDYLIEKSKGKPKDLLKISCELRERFTPIRDYIEDMGRGGSTDSLATLNEIAKAVYNKINNGLPYESKIIFENVHTYSIGIGPVSFSSPIFDIQTDRRIKKLNICVQAFTEIIDDMIKIQHDEFTKTLVENCMKC